LYVMSLPLIFRHYANSVKKINSRALKMICGVWVELNHLTRKFIFSVICVQSVIFATFHLGKVDGDAPACKLFL